MLKITLIVLIVLTALLPARGESAIAAVPIPTFADVPPTGFAFQWVEALYAHGITGACDTNPLIFCRDSPISRAEMAVFLVRSIHGSAFQPPPATGDVFGDVPADHPYGKWIEQLKEDGVTAGCGGDRYCPEDDVTRGQMAVFLLRAKYEAGYVPPLATGEVFIDVSADRPFASWIEQLAAEGITAGCDIDRYCADRLVTRGQMAVFLVRALDLPF